MRHTAANETYTVLSRSYGLLGEGDHICTIYYVGLRSVHNAMGAQRREQVALPEELEETL